MRLSSLLLGAAKHGMKEKMWTRVLEFGRYRPTPLSISHFIQAAKSNTPQQSFVFLRREMPVRMAGVLLEMKLLPETLQKQEGFTEIRQRYSRSFEELLSYDMKADLDDFTESLINIRKRHADTIPTMAGAVMAMKEEYINEDGEMEAGIDDAVQYFLNRLYMSHISVRMLINQYAFAHGVDLPSRDGLIGMIDPYCNVAEVVNKAYKDAAHMCKKHYNTHPELKVSIHNNCELGNIPIQFVYVPSHLFHICFELMKNSMRATMEFPPNVRAGVYPDLHITLAKSASDITLRLSDMGGGIERELIPSLFKYTYTTAAKCEEGVCKAHAKALAGDKSLMAGLGYGLPISQLYAQYFQGNIAMNSMSGLGTDTYVYLKSVEASALEKVPVFKEGQKIYKDKQEKGPADWTNLRLFNSE